MDRYYSVRKGLLIALIMVLAIGLFSSQPVTNAQEQPSTPPSKRSAYVNRTGTKLSASGLDAKNFVIRDGKIRALVELNATPTAASVAVANEITDGPRRLPNVVPNQLQFIHQRKAEFTSKLTQMGMKFKIVGEMTTTISGVIVEVDANQFSKLEQIPDIKAIHPEELVSRDLTKSVPKIGAPIAWDSGLTGRGRRIAIIDDGIDYKHADFGGNASTTFTPGSGANAKVVGGYDLVGDMYDARIETGPGSTPEPDPDPFTCPLPYPTPIFDPADAPVHHGTHVSGIAAGYGVNADGSTYTGPYTSSTPFNSLKIGPGVAPEAQILMYRVFGCYGSTSSLVVAQAIERAVDPNGDGDPRDHADVINMSLGSSYGSGYGPYQTAIDSATNLGVVVVASAGNSADSYFVLGSPSAVGSAISVAGTSASYLEAKVNSPAAIAGSYFGAGASFGPSFTATGVTGNLVYAQPTNGCTALTNAAAVAGNIALIDRGTCGFVVKVKNAQNAGAKAALICNNAAGPAIPMGGTDPTITIPAMMLSQADCATIKSQLPTPGVNITLSMGNAADTLYGSTSRGPRRASTQSDMILKPDVATPGESVISAAGNTGNGSANYSGTSMAAPHVSGFVALLRQQNPTWSATEIKALVMNTAGNDVFVQPNQPTIYGPGRVGSGAINVPNAVNLAGGGPRVIAYDAAHPELVSVSFGLVEATFSTNVSKVIELKNKGNQTVKYQVGLQDVVTQPGTTVSVSPSVVTIPAYGKAYVLVTLHANPASASQPFTHDATVAETQAGLKREWLSEVAGYVTFTAANQPKLRVAYYAAPRPSSLMLALPPLVIPTSVTGSTSLPLFGKGFNTGPLSGDGSQYNVASLVSAYELQYSSPNEAQQFGPLEDHTDLQYVGVTSDYSATKDINTTQLFFALSTYANHSTPKELDAWIFIDKDRDGKDDYLLSVPHLTVSQQPVDVFLSSLQDLNSGESGFQEVLDPLYGADPTTPLETYRYNTNVMVIPVAAGPVSPFGEAGLNLTPGQPFNYHIQMVSYEYETVVDSTPVLTYNPSQPALDFSDPTGTIGGPFAGVPWYFDQSSAENIPVTYNLLNHSDDSPLRILLVHHHNAFAPVRTQVVTIQDIFKVKSRLTLTAICSPDPAHTRVWSVTNPFPEAKNFGWNVFGSIQSGSGTVPAAANGVPGTATFTTKTQPGANMVRLFSDGKLQDTKTSTRCTAAPQPTPTTGPTFQPPTNTPAAP